VRAQLAYGPSAKISPSCLMYFSVNVKSARTCELFSESTMFNN
jgi:hypothetical protein